MWNLENSSRFGVPVTWMSTELMPTVRTRGRMQRQQEIPQERGKLTATGCKSINMAAGIKSWTAKLVGCVVQCYGCGKMGCVFLQKTTTAKRQSPTLKR
jgi:hypothetical protein